MAKSDALQAILAAISTGVPLYNRGDALGCLETYETVARGLLSTPDALPHGGASTLQHALAAAAHGALSVGALRRRAANPPGQQCPRSRAPPPQTPAELRAAPERRRAAGTNTSPLLPYQG